MEALSEWIAECGDIVLFIGLVKLGYNMLIRAFGGSGKLF